MNSFKLLKVSIILLSILVLNIHNSHAQVGCNNGSLELGPGGGNAGNGPVASSTGTFSNSIGRGFNTFFPTINSLLNKVTLK